jgi:hypothetical protein
MKDERHKRWPNAAAELSAKIATDEPVIMWHLDTELTLHVKSIKRTSTGHRIELSSSKITVVITTDETDDVDISFYSKGIAP